MTDGQPAITGNVDAPVAPATETTTTTTPANDAPLSIDDALAKAIEQHVPEGATAADAKPDTKPLLPEIPGAKPEAPPGSPELKPGQVVDPITQRVLEPIRPPGGLTPALRDKWETVPREFQEFWQGRERHMHEQLQEMADTRRSWKEFSDTVAPYEAMLRQHNITATTHVKELFNLSYGLNTGNPQQKADILARLVWQFQPDPAAFAHYLSPQNRPQGQPQQPAPAQQPVNVREEVERQIKERQEAEQAAEGKRAWDAFAADPKHEFINDVRQLMGKILDAELVSGSTYPELFKNAYDLACQQHPEVKAALTQRTAAPAPSPAAATPTPRPNRTAKPSLGGGPRQPTAGGKKLTLDEALAAAAAQHSA